MPVLYAIRSQNSNARKLLAEGLIVLLFINAAIVAYVRLHWEADASAKLRTQLHQMRDSGQTYEVATFFFKDSADVRLTQAGVRFRDVGMRAGAGSQELESVVEGYPLATRFRTAISSPPAQGTGGDICP